MQLISYTAVTSAKGKYNKRAYTKKTTASASPHLIEFSLVPKVEGTTLEVEDDTGRSAYQSSCQLV